MTKAPILFKSKAIRALRGNWQTALVVSFIAQLPVILVQLVQTTQLPTVSPLADVEAMRAALRAVQPQTWALAGLLSGMALALTPVLTLGCNYYFICRLQKQELGFKGLFSRMRYLGKALLLYLLMGIKVALWSLLLFVPGVIAFLRYAMAPYYLAQHPEMSVREALEASKQAMRENKGSFFILDMSFIGWLIAAMFSEMLLADISPILALVASQFIQLFMATYLNAAEASFYLAASTPDGMRTAQAEATAWIAGLRGGIPDGIHPPLGGWPEPDGDKGARTPDEEDQEGDESTDKEPPPPEKDD
ncbi:MAG: DUF975 family protein [Eubacteriales bacterium]|nr:DUF975 family protein [Eubacteriales bacterium]